mmetsp:Transcript_27056/g.49205  ORF Transcript_27056/g.49205 Transcript_27056/m.49205 type:complete len:208 (+) Transcript_27056:1265-1888(+)
MPSTRPAVLHNRRSVLSLTSWYMPLPKKARRTGNFRISPWLSEKAPWPGRFVRAIFLRKRKRAPVAPLVFSIAPNLQRGGATCALVDRAFGVQLCRHICATNHMASHPLCLQRVCQTAVTNLASADNHIVHIQHTWIFPRFAKRDMQTVVVYLFVVNTTQHFDVLHLQRRAVNPARGFAQTFAQRLGFSLHQRDLTCCWMWLGAFWC